jgi:putative membrane protein insertion efficiency factor
MSTQHNHPHDYPHDHPHEHGQACAYGASSCDRRAAFERAAQGLPPLPVWMRVLNAPIIALIKLYQFTLSPIMGRGCLFWPTCSWYGLEAYRTHGPFKGSRLTLWRILRCNPFGGHGYDPVPPRGGPATSTDGREQSA